MHYESENHYEHGRPARLGVLLTNLGTPDAPTPAALRRYLREFLWDPRVVEFPRLPWWLILNGVILNLRPRRSAHAYTKVWTTEGSPLLVHSRAQATGLRQRLEAACPGPVSLALAMRYGTPSIEAGLRELREAGAERLLVLPLYPQYSGSTTGSTFDAVAETLRRWRWVPELRFVNHYHDDLAYIAAMAARIRAHWAEHGRGDHLLFSFHGVPRRYLLAGDPYHCHCHKTARLLAEALALDESGWTLGFQSRFGREEWLKPYVDGLLRTWPSEGRRSVDVFCPGFSADCLETLEEIAMQNRELFIATGGHHYAYIPALNDQAEHLDALTALALRHAAGWPETDPGWSGQTEAAEAEATRRRALENGAQA
ncbi:ferrochelatase [Acidihalobacter yilgarnensis]|uniref:Ferrochelatase n=1 Tax=Acidihalobacter yilgarnensis TaxID=2819280 RepID=A0A1D8IS01_9GAMM|nr:ferrochelatase [Acidihalobacter yilgarnensis]AOU99318.1 ferrochelatase [Acidihalobacter yilgarnensis]